MSSVNAPPAAPCLRPSVEPFELGDLPMFELPPSASVEEGSVDSSMKIYTLAAEAGMATTQVPPAAPRLGSSSPPVDLGVLPPFELPDSCEFPHTFETSTVGATLPRSADTVFTGPSARCSSSSGEVHRVPALAPLSKPVAFDGQMNSEEILSLELGPPELSLSEGPRLAPFADSFDHDDLLPSELPPALPEMPLLVAPTSPSRFASTSEKKDAFETTDRPDAILLCGIRQHVKSFDEFRNFQRTVVLDRHDELMKCDAASMRGRSALRRQAPRVDNIALQQIACSECDFSLSWSTSPLSRKHERAMSSSTMSTSASEIA
eukprot:TRINITY_DN19301_c0_g1_i1.p1 TRINITY_DN19301_c0_g1~~TRINITY_DN19301_c0_g1_i1.p1  ORF type:complete len:320 (-),score=41.75 TRINITY_DN19301_c0_g1_i1:395-1354(-)